MKNIFKNEKFWLVTAGAAGVIFGKKVHHCKENQRTRCYRSCKGNEAHRTMLILLSRA